MRVIRLNSIELSSPGIVEVMNQRRIAPERFGCRDIFDPVPLPQSIGRAEGRETALGGNPRTRKDHNALEAHGLSLAWESRCSIQPASLFSIV